MKSLHIGNVAGQIDLKGKKYKLLSCKCCVLQNLKDKEHSKEAKKEMREYK